MSGKRNKYLFKFALKHRNELVNFFNPDQSKPYNIYRMLKNYYSKNKTVPEL